MKQAIKANNHLVVIKCPPGRWAIVYKNVRKWGLNVVFVLKRAVAQFWYLLRHQPIIMENIDITTAILLKALDIELREMLLEDLQQFRLKQAA